MSVILLFPGQGAQTEGMLRALPQHSAVAATLAEATRVLAVAADDLDSASALASTEGAQIALLIAGVAAARVLAAESSSPQLVAGMSVGAFAAAVVAGALDFESALALVRLRARLMMQAYPHGYGLAALVGLDEKTVRRVVSGIHSAATPVYLANINAPDQIVIAGSDPGLDLVLRAAQSCGAHRVHRLAVNVPSHCPLLRAAAAELATAAAGVPMREAVIPYLENRHARAVKDPEKIRADLTGNMCVAVRWHDMMTSAFERGARLFVEAPPGATLTGLIQSSFPEARAVAFENQSLSSLVSLIRRVAA